MTHAICAMCGAFKPGAFGTCRACGFEVGAPEPGARLSEDQALALRLSDSHRSPSEREAYADRIRDEGSISLDDVPEQPPRDGAGTWTGETAMNHYEDHHSWRVQSAFDRHGFDTALRCFEQRRREDAVLWRLRLQPGPDGRPEVVSLESRQGGRT